MSAQRPLDDDRAARSVLVLTQVLLSSPALGGAGDIPSVLASLIRELTEGDAAFNRRIASTTVCEKTGHTLATRVAYCHGAHWASKGLLRVMARAGLDLAIPDAAGRLPLIQGLANTGMNLTQGVLAWVWSRPGLGPLVVEAPQGSPSRSLLSLDMGPGARAGQIHGSLQATVERALDALSVAARQPALACLVRSQVAPPHAHFAARLRQQHLEAGLGLARSASAAPPRL